MEVILANDGTLRRQQAGIALIVVLLLVATLSLIVTTLTDSTIAAAARARHETARTQMYWRVHGAETLARQLVSQALGQRDGIMSIDDPWANTPFDLSSLASNETEQGTMAIADATGCFNLNSLLVTGSDAELQPPEDPPDRGEALPAAGPDSPFSDDPEEARLIEFEILMEVIGMARSDARQLAIIIRDWIDPDQDPGPGGAEDSTYQRLDVPYRTGATVLASVSELRAMQGVDPVLLRVIEPFVCALPTTQPNRINVNALRPDQAPILVGLFQGALTLGDAEILLERRPLGGFATVEDLLQSPVFAGIPVQQIQNRLDVRSQYLEGRLELIFGKTLLEVRMLFSVDEQNRLALLSRRFGSDR